MLQLSAMAPPQGAGPRESLSRNLAGVPLSAAEPLKVNGLEGYTAIAREVPLTWGSRGPARYAVVYFNNLAYVFMGATRLNSALSATDPLLLSSVKTFRRLRDSEFTRAEPDRLTLVKATSRTRSASTSSGTGFRCRWTRGRSATTRAARSATSSASSSARIRTRRPDGCGCRVVLLAVLVRTQGFEILETWIHPATGMLTFALALLAILWLGTPREQKGNRA